MSWDADLCTPGGLTIREWNYTHNTNRMIAEAYRLQSGLDTPDTDGPLGPAIGPSWWRHLDGMAGENGRAYLADVIRGLEADPDRFRAMNPDNGWGDYDSLLSVLREMRDAVPDEDQTVWRASG